MSSTYLDPFASSRHLLPIHVRMSTVEDLSYTPSAEERRRDAAQVIATGRRSWKTLKGGGEAVWPPNLEAALIQALEEYRPKATKTPGRFPLRNKFISDYIFRVTEKRRTPKQVGSRLQQLRDTCRGKHIMRLVSNLNGHRLDSGSGTTSLSELSTSPQDDSSLRCHSPSHPSECAQPQHTFIHVDILTDSAPSCPIINIVDQESAPHRIRFTSLSLETPHIYANMDATVMFASPCPLSSTTAFSVFIDGTGAPVHTETTLLTCCSSPYQGCGWLYKSTLIPAFWNILCDSGDPGCYTISQDLVPLYRDPVTELYSEDGDVVLTLVYSLERPYTLPNPLAFSHSMQQSHETEALPSPVNAEFAVRSLPSPFVTSTEFSSQSGSNAHRPLHHMVPEPGPRINGQSFESTGQGNVPRCQPIQGTPLYASQHTTYDFGDTTGAYDTSLTPMISKSGCVMTSSCDHIPETEFRRASRDSWPVNQSYQSLPDYGYPNTFCNDICCVSFVDRYEPVNLH